MQSLTVDIARFFPRKKKSNGYKTRMIKEIKKHVCSLLNGKGGKIEISFTDSAPKKKLLDFVRIIEQSCVSFIGEILMTSNIHFRLSDEDKVPKVVCEIEETESLITVEYNVYVRSFTQVQQISIGSNVSQIQHFILNRKTVEDPILHGTHHKQFKKNQPCGFTEDKVVEFKLVDAQKANRTALGDRIMSNKFPAYVSGFSNSRGGHLYYGIDDDGIVQGETIPNKKDINEIEKKVEKAINKMIWPNKPKRGEHWDIFFEPVVDENSRPIPSTLVIVIFIAPCCDGAVFTEEPESYQAVGEEIEKLSFDDWKKRFFHPTAKSSHALAISHPITTKYIKWISSCIQKICTEVFCTLTLLLNDGDLKGFNAKATEFEKEYPEMVEVKLVVLLKKILARSRRHNFVAANRLLMTYNGLVQSTKEVQIFNVLGQYAKAALTRPNKGPDLENLLEEALVRAGQILPGLVTAIIYLFAGTMIERQDVLANNALQHLQHGVIGRLDEDKARADLEHRAHITCAAFSLGCNLSGTIFVDHVDSTQIKAAEDHIRAVEQYINEDNKLTHYREAQFHLVKSILNARYSEVKACDEKPYMRKAFDLLKNAEDVARKYQFNETSEWCKSLKSLYTQKLLRRSKKLIQLQNKC